MANKMKFQIDHLDPMGQGVSKSDHGICFVSKTLPDESGQAVTLKKTKGVSFAYLDSPSQLDKTSPNRQLSTCEHFDQCGGCHYLHTNYDCEIQFKLASLKWRFKKQDLPEIEILKSPQRDHYRNRLQLHYDLPKKLLGLKHVNQHKIISVPNCQLPLPKVQEKLDQLYRDNEWQKLAQAQSKKSGHVEIYQKPDESIEVSWNQSYANNGFTQVNQPANQLLVNLVTGWFSTKNSKVKKVVDLFGGCGNLTQSITNSEVLVIDRSPNAELIDENQKYLSYNLFSDENQLLELIEIISDQLSGTPDWLVLDPPRSGYKFLQPMLQKMKVPNIVYVSCDSATLARDISGLFPDYEISKMALIDLFPGTYHYETAIMLQRRALYL